MKEFFNILRTYIFRGLLAIIPLALSFFAVRFIYVYIDKRIADFLSEYIGYRIPGLGLLLVLVVLCLIGFLASNYIGRQFFNLLENIAKIIPLVKTTYQVGKQLSETFSVQDRQPFKKVVMIECFKNDIWLIGFITGETVDHTLNKKWLKVLIPTTPSPMSGFIILVEEKLVRDTGWSVEEALKVVISGGIIEGESINKR